MSTTDTTGTTADPRGVDDLPSWVRRSWVSVLVLGLLMLGLGLLLVFNLAASVSTLRWLVVISLVLAAVEAFATASLRERRWVGWLAGLLYAAGAVVAVAWPGVTLFVLVLTVGISLLTGGIVQAVMSWRARGQAKGWGWSFAMGLLSVLAGLVFLFGSPLISVAVLAIVLAVHVLMTGVTLVALALAIRRLAANVAASQRPA
jgi:uncharacterized membrane protein HdeD (DUF308 family)